MIFFHFSLYMLAALGFAAIPSTNGLRGVDPKDSAKYDASKPTFTCFDKSKTIPFEAVNDNYCDCKDGSDEPGTSACPTGKFFCANAGHISATLPASRVDDGICDVSCCDGTDEKECPDVCVKEAAEHHRKRVEQAKIHSEGMRIKQEYLAYGKELLNKRQAEIQTLLVDISAKEKQLLTLAAEKKRTSEILDSFENGPKVKQHEDSLKKTKAFLVPLKEKLQELETELFSVKHMLSAHPEPAFQDFKTTVEAFVAKFDALELQPFYNMPLLTSPEYDDSTGIEAGHNEEADYDDEIIEHDNDGQAVSEAPEPIDQLPLSITEHASRYYDKCIAPVWEDVLASITGSAAPSDAERARTAAHKAKERWEEVDREKSELSSRLESLQTKAGLNYGPGNVFAKLENECFEFNNGEYIYEVCPFKDAQQKKDTGTVVANLGHWKNWSADETDIKVMRFTNGAHCWNGPQRSMTVKLKCGTENKILSVSEPNKCEYEMQMLTPVVCEGSAGAVYID